MRDGAAILLGTDIRLGRYQPEPVLVVPREQVPRAAYPGHRHPLAPRITDRRPSRRSVWSRPWTPPASRKSSTWADCHRLFKQAASTFAARYPDRFILFVKPDMAAAVSRPDGLEAGVRPRKSVGSRKPPALGAQGVKISKSFGMGHFDRAGRLLAPDDPRLDPIWAKAGQLGMPVLIHTADPEAFFRPADARNERYEEILGNPEWSRYGKAPSREELFAQRERLLARHPGTNFIGAHFGMQEDDLAQVAALLDRYPNYFVDIAAVVHALGRQPVTARNFFIRFQDRIVFGTDGGYGLVAQQPGWTPERLYQSYFEFLETSNEYVEYPMWGAHNQGRWRIYGVDLPEEVLEKIYRRNAERLIPHARGGRAAARRPRRKHR